MTTATVPPITDSIPLELLIPDLLAEHPQARAVLDRYGLRGCGGRLGPVESLRFFAETHGVQHDQLLREIRQAAAQPPCAHAAPAAPTIADTIYRRFFLGGIILILTAGATWGAWLLWQIGFAGKFTAISIHHVNAHGQAQIFGWCGLFIMGFAYQAFPRIWHTDLAWSRLATWVFGSMVLALILRTVGMIGGGAAALSLAMIGGAIQFAAVVAFAAQLLATVRRARPKLEPYIGFVIIALGSFVVMTAFDQWHTYRTMTAATQKDLLWQITTYQAPLRDLQIHGLVMFMILGVSLRMLPPLFGLSAVANSRAWRALAVLTAAVLGEIAIFIAYRFTNSHALAATLMIPWIMLAIGSWMVAAPWQLWRKPRVYDRSSKFVRTAYLWLGISLVMLLLLPVYQWISGIAFSHAYYGAIRHAITVGFISLMIMGVAAKVVPTLNGIDVRRLPALWGPFILINVGCALRVSLQTGTDWHGAFFLTVGVSGVLEVTALAWWGIGLARIMLAGKRRADADAVASSRPEHVEPDHLVSDVLAWDPSALQVLLAHGFAPLANPLLRRTLARATTLRQAAALRGVHLNRLIDDLNESRQPSCASCGPSE